MKTLREVRNEKYYSIRELAKLAGVSYDTVLRIESGEFKPGKLRPATMRKIALALGVPPNEITEFQRTV